MAIILARPNRGARKMSSTDVTSVLTTERIEMAIFSQFAPFGNFGQTKRLTFW
tara:strand:- start:2424 stop:2582 length:159 start_codon:yes stop_codon:yes gene_type:complete